MPAAIVHYLHGERIWDWLEKEGVVQRERLVKDTFDWGKQGPDFLFCHRFFPWQKGESLEESGEKLHSLPAEKTLSCLQKIWQERPVAEVRSYILGFLCHYSLDRTCHPFIEFQSRQLLKQEPTQTESIFHNEIESALDGIVFRWELGKLPSEFPLGKTLPKNLETEETIAQIYDRLLESLLHQKGKENELHQAQKDARMIFRALYDRTGLKKQLFLKLEAKKQRKISCHLRGMVEDGEQDYANTAQEEWSDRQGNARTENFFELFEQGVEDAKALILAFPEGDIRQLTAGKNF